MTELITNGSFATALTGWTPGGGGTTDWQAVMPGGIPDPETVGSEPVGILDVIKDFRREFEGRHASDMKMGGSLTFDQIRQGLDCDPLE